MKQRKYWLIITIGIMAIILVATVAGNLVSYLWNWLMPELFGLRQITFWQALGLLALCRILFGGTGRGGGGGRRREYTPEEKARFRQRLRERFGFKRPEESTNGV
jgi:hypothetical protein